MQPGEKQLGEMQHFNTTPLVEMQPGEMQFGEMQLSRFNAENERSYNMKLGIVVYTYCDLGFSYVESRSYSSMELTFVRGCRSFDKVINESSENHSLDTVIEIAGLMAEARSVC
ncbi:hypothetical protein H8356DRAFT_1398192 [Neocallimastix lanati (nom. inval.)]|nr:hypothetical protein H8356DRAFT_1398192 [Neocallimastix sp. JGI-2020a]